MMIALVVPEFPPDTIGGGGPVFESLARALDGRGHEIKVLTSATHRGPMAQDERYPFPVLRVKQFPHFTSQFRAYMPPLPHALLPVRAFLRHADVFHLHGYGTPFIDVIFNVFTARRRAVFTSHGFLYSVPSWGGPIATAYTLYDTLFGRNVLVKSARATAVSSQLAEKAARLSGRSVITIPNGFVPLGDGNVLDASLRAESEKGPYVIAVGRLEPLKGFDVLLRAIAVLHEQGVGLRVLLAGADNGQGEPLRHLSRSLNIEHAISFLGAVERPQLAPLYRRARAAVVSSLYESFSLVTLEAMSSGVPCVLSAVGGILDIATDGKDALLFPTGHVASLAGQLLALERSEELRARLAASGKETVRRFSWDTVSKAYEDVYLSCL